MAHFGRLGDCTAGDRAINRLGPLVEIAIFMSNFHDFSLFRAQVAGSRKTSQKWPGSLCWCAFFVVVFCAAYRKSSVWGHGILRALPGGPMIKIPRYDIFFGTFGEDARWLEAVKARETHWTE
jgi:hypothetical protein